MTPTNEPTPIPHEPRLVEAALGLDVVSVCSRLVAVLADSAHGWRVAADAIDDDAFASQMRVIAGSREDFAVELSNVVSGRSGTVVARHTLAGELMTWWLQARSLMTKGDTAAILSVCRLGSRSSQAEFDRALATAMPDAIRDIVVRQANEIRSSADWLASIS